MKGWPGSRGTSQGSTGLVGLVRLGQVTLHVQRQVIGSGKAPFADLAFERLSAGVLAVMAGQLI